MSVKERKGWENSGSVGSLSTRESGGDNKLIDSIRQWVYLPAISNAYILKISTHIYNAM